MSRFSRRIVSILNGLLFGAFAVIAMTQPFTITSGFYLDGRTVVIAIAGLFGGVIPALITTVMVCLYRLSVGGVGTIGAIGAALSVLILYVPARRYLHRRGQTYPTYAQLLIGGAVLSLIGGIWTLITFHFETAMVAQTVPITMLIYPLGMLLLGSLLTFQRRSIETEQSLRESEHRYRALFESAYAFTGVLKADGTLIEANRTALDFFEMTLDQMVGLRLWEITPTLSPGEVEHVKSLVERAAAGESMHFETDMTNASGRTVTVDFSLRPIFDENGQVVLLLPEGHDITARKHYESQKLDLALERERSVLLKKFISDMSHDFRTPLSVIRLNLELLQRTKDPAQQQRRVEVLLQESDRLAHMLDDMKVMLSLDEETPLTFTMLNVNVLATHVVDAQKKNAQAKKLTLISDFTPTELMISGASDDLQRALSNLIVNAITYTSTFGTITVTTQMAQNCAVIEVQDTGIGIDAGDLPHIFQRFYRADQARSLHTGGNGLGLAMTKKIIDLHGGSIEVESATGAGSTFRVRLPL